ncbi:MAG: CPBP family intramembrane metalloprotease [Leptolyngbyaceae cyanobacterium RM1_1_2]|nr:CPBP family intramembrane metalloprotease [Leptolyngbyaceae cyanobacterium RM1_1_2]
MRGSANPFEALKFRWVLLGLLGAGLGWGILLSLIETAGWWPLVITGPLMQPVLYLLMTLSLWPIVLWLGRNQRIRYRRLIGFRPKYFSWATGMALAIALVIFSLGSSQLLFYGLSFVAPIITEGFRQAPPLLTAETRLPWLYNGLMLLYLVAVAPVTEEFVFRGILLHRWGTKWGVPAAVILSSVLFGLLHVNPVGLFVFGLVMALLYLKTRSLWVPIFCHMINNALAIALELLPFGPESSLVTFQDGWLGLILIGISAPWLLRFVLQNWSKTHEALPYFVNDTQA